MVAADARSGDDQSSPSTPFLPGRRASQFAADSPRPPVVPGRVVDAGVAGNPEPRSARDSAGGQRLRQGPELLVDPLHILVSHL